MQVLTVLNDIIIGLNGLPVMPGSFIQNSRLEPYALVVLFYKLSKSFPQYTYEEVLPLILNNAPISDILNL